MHISSIVLEVDRGQKQIVQFQFLLPQYAVWEQVTGSMQAGERSTAVGILEKSLRMEPQLFKSSSLDKSLDLVGSIPRLEDPLEEGMVTRTDTHTHTDTHTQTQTHTRQ